MIHTMDKTQKSQPTSTRSGLVLPVICGNPVAHLWITIPSKAARTGHQQGQEGVGMEKDSLPRCYVPEGNNTEGNPLNGLEQTSRP